MNPGSRIKPSPAAARLTQRERAILKDLIATYILRAEPVSSRAVAKHGDHGLSSASIRNIMADLEDQGFLSQPHTSAGRVPTAKAYHLYVDSLMGRSVVTQGERRYICDALLSGKQEAAQLVSSVSQLLSELSSQVGIVLTPVISETVLKTIHFVKVAETKVLCVVVSTGGFVDNKVIETLEPLDQGELERASNYLTENFAGLTLRQARERLLRQLSDERAAMNRQMEMTILLARQGLDVGRAPDLVLDGANGLLNQPELADVERVKRLLDTFSDKVRLVYLLTECMRGEGVRVLIDDDNELTSELGFSLVTKPYGTGSAMLGTIGIFGPSRMDYPRVVPLVELLSEVLSEALEGTFSEPN